MTENSGKAKILIAEDEVLIAADLASRLKGLGYSVCGQATNGVKALELVEQHQPDLVMMDIVLQGDIDGIDAAEVIKEKCGIPVVFLTAYADTERLERAKLTYPFGYLLKPFQDRDLKITSEMALYVAKVDAERRETEEALLKSKGQYKDLFENMSSGFALHRIITDEKGTAADYVFLEMNESFEELTGLQRHDVLGKSIKTILPDIENDPADWIGLYGKVALEGKPVKFEQYSQPLDRWYSVNAYCPSYGLFATIFEDITNQKRTEEALIESEERFRGIVEFTDAGYFFIDNKGFIKDVNDAWVKIYKYESKQEVIDNHFTTIQKEDDIENAKRFVAGIMEGNKEYQTGEFSRKCKDASIGYHTFSARPVSRRGEIVGIEGFIIDTTKRKLTEDALAEVSERLRLALDSAQAGVWIWDIKTGDVFWDERMQEIFGYHPGEFEGTFEAWKSRVHPEDMYAAETATLAAANSGGRYEFEYRALGLDNAWRWVRASAIVTVDDYAEPLRMVGMAIDITERKQAEESLKESEEKYRIIFENSNDALFIHEVMEDGTPGRFLDVNRVACDRLGYTREEFLSFSPLDIGLVGQNESVRALGNRLLDEKRGIFETTHVTKDGRHIPVESSACIIEFKGQSAILSIARDITDRKQSEKKLRQSEQRLKNIADNVPGLVLRYKLNPDGSDELLYISKGVEKFFGVPQEIAMQNNQLLWDRIHKDYLDQYIASIKESKENLSVWEFEHKLVMPNGQEKWAQARGVPQQHDDGSVIWDTIQIDISDRKKAEFELQKRKSMLEYAESMANLGSWEWDITSDIWTFSDQWLYIHGCQSEYLKSDELMQIAHPDDRAHIEHAFQEALNNEKPYDIEHRIHRQSDNVIRYIKAYGEIKTDLSGNPVKMYGAAQDITELKKTEEQILGTLNEKETLLKELNHRVKNNMAVIISLLRLQSDKINNEQLKTCFLETQNRIYAMSAVHESLHQSDNLASVDLAEYLIKLSETTFHTYRTDGGTIRFSSEISSIPVNLDKSYPIGLVINELLSNSLKYAFPDGKAGEITIAGELERNTAKLVVSDTGIGIPQDFDWRDTESLGLQLVRSLVENQLQGTIDLDRTHGTKWTITFPV